MGASFGICVAQRDLALLNSRKAPAWRDEDAVGQRISQDDGGKFNRSGGEAILD